MRIGVLGAGQLGRMLALAGYPLGLDFVFMDPSASACAAPLGEHIHADYDDEHALTEFCHRVDRATFEFENVPAPAARFVAERTTLLPDVAALGGFQDRLEEKQRFSDLGIALAPFSAVDSAATLSAAIDTIGLPAVLKTRRLGYDGKGQAVLRSADDVAPAWEALGGQALVLEAFVPFDREVSILAVRGCDGATAFYPLVENVHRDGILRTSRPRAEDPMQARAEQAASRVLDAFDYVGVMAFEFFVRGGELLANEVAPRVHNSGHWTIEGAQCSQFENHLRAVAGLPLGSTALRGPCAMVNFIGSAPPTAALAAIPGLHIHHYGKAAKPQRKVGHATITADTEAELDSALERVIALVDAAA